MAGSRRRFLGILTGCTVGLVGCSENTDSGTEDPDQQGQPTASNSRKSDSPDQTADNESDTASTQSQDDQIGSDTTQTGESDVESFMDTLGHHWIELEQASEQLTAPLEYNNSYASMIQWDEETVEMPSGDVVDFHTMYVELERLTSNRDGDYAIYMRFINSENWDESKGISGNGEDVRNAIQTLGGENGYQDESVIEFLSANITGYNDLSAELPEKFLNPLNQQ